MIWATNPQPDGTREVVLGLTAAEIARLLSGAVAQIALDDGALKIVLIASSTQQDVIDTMVVDGLASIQALASAAPSAPDPAVPAS